MVVRGAISRPQRLLELVNLVYAIEDREQMLATLFAELQRVFAFSSGVLLPIDPDRFEMQGAVCFDCPGENTAPYLENYAAFDPYVLRDPRSLILNQAVRMSDLVGNRDVDHSEFAEFMAMVPYRHAVAAVCGLNGQPLAAFSVHRSKHQADFTAQEVAIVDCIAPHLGRSLAVRAWLADPAKREEVALLAFDGNGQLLFMNALARGLFAVEHVAPALAALPPAGRGILSLGLQRYRVSELPWRAASLLTYFVQPAADSPSRNLSAPARADVRNTVDWADARRVGAQLRIVTLLPFRRRDDLHTRLERYGLSRRELVITEQGIRSGLANAELARSLCISEQTVKSHLREAYRKIGVSSRRELVVKVLGLETGLRADADERTRRQPVEPGPGGS